MKIIFRLWITLLCAQPLLNIQFSSSFLVPFNNKFTLFRLFLKFPFDFASFAKNVVGTFYLYTISYYNFP